MTRPGASFRVPDPAGGPPAAPLRTVYGATFEHTAHPTRPIEGIARDHRTRAPLAGVRLEAGPDGIVRATTDAEGRYRLVGLPESAKARITAVPPADQPYPGAAWDVDTGRGPGPVAHDIALVRGVWLTGQVTDASTGHPVQAWVEYSPFQGNPSVEGFGGWPTRQAKETGSDGRFRLVAYPGSGAVTAVTHDRRYAQGLGAGKIKADRLRTIFLPPNFNTIAEVDLGKNGGETEHCNLAVDTGHSRDGIIYDPNGAPVSGSVALGLASPGSLGSIGANFRAEGLVTGQSRRLFFRHERRRLVGAVAASGDRKEPLRVTLVPWGSASGRLVDDAGRPRAGVSLLIMGDAAGIAMGGATNEPQKFGTGADGRFRVQALVPGETYELGVFVDGVGIPGYAVKGLTVKAGETKELGDLKFKSY
jgi:hypothetical protein